MEREAYGDFARIYDVFMDNVNYREWAAYLSGTLTEYGIRDGLVLELGCGTGTMTELLAGAGYDMIGGTTQRKCLRRRWRNAWNPAIPFSISARTCRSLSSTEPCGRL